MSSWQRKARLLVAIGAVSVAIAVALAYRRAPAARPSGEGLPPPDPKALVESENAQEIRFNREKEEIIIAWKKQASYAEGPTRLEGVKVTTVRAGGRTFIVTADRAEVEQNETSMTMTGHVVLANSDGMEAKTEHATYTYADSVLRAPEAIEFTRGRMHGTGNGLTYSKNVDVLTIHEDAVVDVAANDKGAGASKIFAGTAEFSRLDHVIRFTRGMKVVRNSQTIEADSGTARLSADDQRVEAVELRGNSRMLGEKAAVGGLTGMRGHDMDLTYQPDGETLERAQVRGEAVAQVGGGQGQGDRIIAANTMDVAIAPDGSTPTNLIARDNVRLTIPGDSGSPARTIDAPTLDAKGEPGRGLTQAHFAGGVEFSERGAGVDRLARSRTLDVALAPGLSEIEEARFAQTVRFAEGGMRAMAANARYLLAKGILELTGSEPGIVTPQVVNERISVYATRIDMTLSGPTVKAVGAVKSELKPARKDARNKPDTGTRMPSMFKQDQLVAATAGELLYEGADSKAAYSRGAQLWQGDTSVKGDTINLNEKTGDMTASGSVVTTISLEHEGADKKRERVPTTGASSEFQYEEEHRRATYVTQAHVSGPQGDMTAKKIELYLNESGDEVDRVEAYEEVTLHDSNRETKGARMTYLAALDQYVVTGAPAVIKDECARETTGKKVTYNKRIDTVIVDGSEQGRTQTRGGGANGGANCP